MGACLRHVSASCRLPKKVNIISHFRWYLVLLPLLQLCRIAHLELWAFDKNHKRPSPSPTELTGNTKQSMIPRYYPLYPHIACSMYMAVPEYIEVWIFSNTQIKQVDTCTSS